MPSLSKERNELPKKAERAAELDKARTTNL